MKNVRKKMLSYCLLSLMSYSSNAFAEAAGEPVETRNVVVTATRTEQDIKETPMAVTVITAADIERKGATTLRQVLDNVLNVQIDKDGMGRSTISMRGLEARHTLVLVDGKRMSGESGMSSSNSFDIDRIRLENVERVEILRGPASSLYGSDAMGGVINIITKNPQKQQIEVTLENGTFSGQGSAFNNFGLRYDSGKQGNFSWSLNAAHKEDRPYNTDNNMTLNYYGTRLPIGLKGVWDLGRNRRMIFDVDYMKEKMEKLDSYWNVNQNSRWNYSVAYEAKEQNRDYMLRFYQSIYEKDYESRVKTTGVLRNFDVVRRETTVGEGKTSFAWGENSLVTLGGEFRRERIVGTRVNTGLDNFTLYREGQSSAGSAGGIDYSAVYLQNEWKVSPRLLVIPSLRLDGSSKFDSAWSPKVGVTYTLDRSNRLKFVFGQGYKTPTPTELYHSWQMISYRSPAMPGYWWEGNPALQPEKSQSAEVAWEWDMGPRSARVGLFHNRVSDLIESYNTGRTRPTGGITYDRIYSYRNVASATIQGVETEYRQKMGKNWNVSLNYAYLSAVNNDTGERLSDKATHKFGTTLTFADAKNDFSAVLSGSWVSGLLDSNENREKAYTLWNLMLNKKLGANTTVYAGIDNIFNYKDEYLWINGMVYRLGMKLKF